MFRLGSRLYAGKRFPSNLTNHSSVQVTRLDNGVTVATQKSAGKMASLAVHFRAGSGLETKENSGAAHYLEHMVFNGTTKRSRQALEKEVEDMGGLLNAYTSRGQTAFSIECFGSDVPKAGEILGDLLQNAKVSDEAMELERDTILLEEETTAENPCETVLERAFAVAFQGHALGMPVLGPRQSIRDMTKDAVLQYRKEAFVGDRTVVVAAGAVEHEALVKVAKQNLGHLTKSSGLSFSPASFVAGQMLERDDRQRNVHAAFLFPTVPASHPDSVPLYVLENLVGGWSVLDPGKDLVPGRLNETLAKEGLVQQMQTVQFQYEHNGVFGSYVTMDPDQAENATCEILSEFVRLGTAPGPTEAEVERAKAVAKARYARELDGYDALTDIMGQHFVQYGRYITPAEMFMLIDYVDAKEVRRVAHKYLVDQDPAVAALGPLQHFPDYNYIKQWSTGFIS